jgi:four helix bundle protein
VNPEEFKSRTKGLGLAVIKLVDSLPRRGSAQIIGTQLLRAATSVGANYRAACRGRSAADVIAKLHIVLEEVDETAYWLELLLESGHASADSIDDLLTEANEITAMTVTSLKTLKSRYPRRGAHSIQD